MLSKPGKTVKRARALRRTMTLPEVVLWQVLRDHPGGLRFRRQHPAGAYVLDFYCAAARLAIEVDGEVHARGNMPERDAVRDAILAKHDIATLRVPARDVLEDMDAVMRQIVSHAGARLPLRHADGVPPPQAELGEE
ncbi:endonuclease domain-containing protein [Sphingomonas sp. Leaf343]|uniref:endonuclease domain-containing protein n=1 Tax=Sphingomonas sp. Leaf343 TaxID=1736345 RepID=UPI0007012F8C|nr:endonuclease domain-containing protein [Sphingomonas sp. Leaf343]KQR83045.1 hypothetical protein ASG07_08655 [Sphingomonas sp. Leaf343]